VKHLREDATRSFGRQLGASTPSLYGVLMSALERQLMQTFAGCCPRRKIVKLPALRSEGEKARVSSKSLEEKAGFVRMEIFVGTYMRRWLSPCHSRTTERKTALLGSFCVSGLFSGVLNLDLDEKTPTFFRVPCVRFGTGLYSVFYG
jgi:hypothetical protein